MVLIKHSIQPVGTPGLGLPPSHRATDVAGKREVFRPKPLPLQVVGSSHGVEVKFYNMEVQLDENLESIHPGLFIIGDGSGVTHSLSHASASGVHVAREILSRRGA